MRRSRVAFFAVVLAAVCLSVAPAGAQRPGAAGRPEVFVPRKVTLDLKNVPLADAIRQVIAATDLSVIVSGELPREPRVTLRVVNAEPVGVLELLAHAGQLEFSPVQHGEMTVILIGPIGARPPANMPGGWRVGPVPSASAGEATPPAAAIMETNLAVDLDVDNAPFRDAIANIAKQIPETEQLRLVVDEAVPKDLRVTARLRKMRLNWVLDSLIQQANLTYGVQDQVDPKVLEVLKGRLAAGMMGQAEMQEQLAKAPRVRTIYIVPKPELRVSSAGPMK